MAKGETTYSQKVSGTPKNYHWSASFNITDGYLGITQYDGDKVKDVVLLSPGQVREMLAFVEKSKR